MISLDDVVMSHIANKGKNTTKGYLRYMKWALDGLRRWHSQGWVEDKIAVLEMDSKMSVPFPDDMISWTKLAMKVGDRTVAFNFDPSIDISHQCDDTKQPNPPYNDVITLDQYPQRFFEGYDEWLSDGIYFGHPVMYVHNNVGYFTVNYQCREFQFSSEVRKTPVILVYKTNGFNPDSETLLNELAATTIEAWIEYQEKKWEFGEASAETQYSKQNYFDVYKEAYAHLNSLDWDDIRDVLNRNRYAGRT